MSEYAVINPATGEQLSTYDTFTDAQVQDALAQTKAVFDGWSRSSTPAVSASAMMVRTSSSVTLSSDSPFWPSKARTRFSIDRPYRGVPGSLFMLI